MAEEYEYVLFIDEAGDDGLNRVRPIDVDGASEWLIIGAILIRKSKEDQLGEWLKSIKEDINSTQSSNLHYKNLSPKKRLRACELLSKKDCVFFSVSSNKKNMRGHRNEKAEK